MPYYEYRCPKCEKDFDRFLPIDQRHEGTCPCCGAKGELKMSLSNWRWAVPWSILGAHGEVLAHHPRGGETEPVAPPDRNLVEV